jgi:hypothetical protein
MMGTFIPPGYGLLRDVRTDILRGQLATGKRTAFKIRDGRLEGIHRSEWVAEPSGGAMLECGYWVPLGFRHHYPKYPIVVAMAEEAAAIPAEATKDPRGRKGYDWDPFWREVTRIADSLDGLPETQAELETIMSKWCEEAWGKEPAPSTVRERLSPIYAAKRKGRK